MAKTKALISCAVNAQLISVFVFAYANCWFSRAKAQIFNVSVLVLDEESLDELLGPGKVEQWTHWKYRTDEHNNRIATKNELERILKSHDVRPPIIIL